jgi:hypothetical protein
MLLFGLSFHKTIAAVAHGVCVSGGAPEWGWDLGWVHWVHWSESAGGSKASPHIIEQATKRRPYPNREEEFTEQRSRSLASLSFVAALSRARLGTPKARLIGAGGAILDGARFSMRNRSSEMSGVVGRGEERKRIPAQLHLGLARAFFFGPCGGSSFSSSHRKFEIGKTPTRARPQAVAQQGLIRSKHTAI